VPFVKMHAAGNAFVLVDGLEGLELDWAQLAAQTADPHFAIGHDGLLVVLPSETADFRQRMFNPDGTEDMCGNGLRCVAKHVHDAGRVGSEVVLETTSGPRRIELLGASGPTAQARCGLGVPSVRALPLRLSDLPPETTAALADAHRDALDSALGGAVHVSLGTPHVVLHAEADLPDAAWAVLSEALEHRALDQEHTSVTWFRHAGSGAIAARFWERAVGETLACGTGAAASIVAARRAGVAGEEAAVLTRGGELRASWDGRGEVYVEGPATTVFTGRWPMASNG
jgi:diaminopimelate epimerase